MRVSIAFSGFGGLESTFPAVLAAEEAGLDGVWTAEHLGFHDAIVPSAMYLRATKRIEIGMVGFSPVSRHPAVLSMELGSMVGTGDEGLVAKLGRRVPKPLGATRAFVQSIRETMAGRDMKVSYPEYEFDGFRMTPLGAVPPIDVMAIRPKMLEVAAEVGDGLSLSAGASFEYMRDTVALIEKKLAEAGRERSSFRITAIVITAIGDDLDTIRAPLAPMLSTFPQHTAGYLARGVIDPDELLAAEKAGGPFAVMKMWTPERIDQIAMVTTPGGLGDALGRYAATGIDEVALMMLNMPEQQPELIRLLAAARPREEATR
jgi:alkanesulfonate monooxygenase SsuD/methylene tetrahydromethanopterin reductase-like flavin-dependent oxidoreductase (luciferase family)